MRRFLFAVLSISVALPLCAQDADLTAARAFFEKNLDAIRQRDRAAYLVLYLDSPTLARSGFSGTELGREEFVKQAGKWPDVFTADDLRLVPITTGVVYGSYRYRVRYGAEEHAGLSERFFVRTPAGWRIAVTTAFDAPPGTPPPARVLTGATLYDGNGGPPVRDSVIVLREGKVECAGTRAACPVPEGIAVEDLTGTFVTPGLIDAHVHFSQSGWCDGRPDALDARAKHPYEEVEAELKRDPERFLRTDVCSGVTSVFDVGGYPWTLRLPQRAAADGLAPRVRAAGPLLSTVDHWLNLPAERQFIFLKDEEAARSGVRYLASQGASAVKVWYIVDDKHTVEASEAAVRAAGDEAVRAKLPLIVHATGLAEAKAALKAGAKLLVHSVWDKPVDDEFLDLARKAGAIYCPTLVVMGGYVRLREAAAAKRAPEIDDPNGCVDAKTRALVLETATLDPGKTSEELAKQGERIAGFTRTAMANLKRVNAAGIPIAMGTDAGNPLTLHGVSVYAEMEAMEAAGMKPMDVLVAATRTASRAMGADAETGTLEKGKAADLLVLDADPGRDVHAFRKLRAVVRGGVIRPIEELRAPAPAPR